MYDYPEADKSTDKRPRALEDLDRELAELDEAIQKLCTMLGPITNQYAQVEARLSEPHPEPSSQIRGRVERLRSYREQLYRLMNDLDL